MSKCDTARTNYEAARKELVTRVRLRDQVLLVYLGFVGALFGVALGTSGTNSGIADCEVLLVVPYLAFGCSILVSQHNAVIGALIKFNTEHVSLFLKENYEEAPEFTNSEAFKHHSPISNSLRSWGHGIILLVPCIISLGANCDAAFHAPFPMGPTWWFAAVFTLGTLAVIRQVHNVRRRVYGSTTWYKPYRSTASSRKSWRSREN